MLVSTVIPAYNYARFVGRAIDSVLAQTHRDVECIVVDDGSTDDTPAVLARYGDRIRAIRQENRGLSATRNTGIKASRGELIALLDADDEWKPEKLATQLPVLANDPDVAAVGCACDYLDIEGRSIGSGFKPSPERGAAGLRAVATRKSFVSSSSSGAVIRRRVLDEVGLFDETLTAAEDWDMWLRIAARYAIVNLPEVLVRVHRHNTGSFRNAAKMQTNQQKVYEAAIQRWPDQLDEGTRRDMRALIAADAARELALAGDHRRALASYLRSLRANPFQRKIWYQTARTVGRLVGV
jgi:glycosyltransferase involved in cell wall biosynthesis